MTTLEQMREDFHTKFGCDQCDLRGGNGGEYYADYWLSLIEQDRIQIREELIREIEGMNGVFISVPYRGHNRVHTTTSVEMIDKKEVSDLITHLSEKK